MNMYFTVKTATMVHTKYALNNDSNNDSNYDCIDDSNEQN